MEEFGGSDAGGCRHHRGRAGGRALRDHPLRHADRLGQAAGQSEAEGLLKETLIEEENTDGVLSDLAEEAINPKAA